MNRIKTQSSIKLFQNFPNLRNRYCVHLLCTKGCFDVISGEGRTENMIKIFNYTQVSKTSLARIGDFFL